MLFADIHAQRDEESRVGGFVASTDGVGVAIDDLCRAVFVTKDELTDISGPAVPAAPSCVAKARAEVRSGYCRSDSRRYGIRLAF